MPGLYSRASPYCYSPVTLGGMVITAKYAQIAADLRAQIAQGVFKPGDPVPTEAELAASYHVARMTARRGLQELEQAGLLAPGHPRRVARYEPLAVHITRTADRVHPGESPSLGADSWVGDMLAAGQEPAQDIRVATTLAGTEVARRLEVGELSVVIARKLVRQAGGKPHNLVTFWFPLSVASGTVLDHPGSVTEGTLAWLEREHGPLSHTVEVTARMPYPDETQLLGIPAGVPVIAVTRGSRDASRPVVASLAVYPADRTTLFLDL